MSRASDPDRAAQNANRYIECERSYRTRRWIRRGLLLGGLIVLKVGEYCSSPLHEISSVLGGFLLILAILFMCLLRSEDEPIL